MNLISIWVLCAGIYFGIFFAFLLINAVINGYNGTELIFKDVTDSFYWPVSGAVLLGAVIRLIVQHFQHFQKD